MLLFFRPAKTKSTVRRNKFVSEQTCYISMLSPPCLKVKPCFLWWKIMGTLECVNQRTIHLFKLQLCDQLIYLTQFFPAKMLFEHQKRNDRTQNSVALRLMHALYRVWARCILKLNRRRTSDCFGIHLISNDCIRHDNNDDSALERESWKKREPMVDDKTTLNSQSTHFFSFSYLFKLIIGLKMILLNDPRDNYIYTTVCTQCARRRARNLMAAPQAGVRGLKLIRIAEKTEPIRVSIGVRNFNMSLYSKIKPNHLWKQWGERSSQRGKIKKKKKKQGILF